MFAQTGIAPLTLTLSPEGRGDAGGSAGETDNASAIYLSRARHEVENVTPAVGTHISVPSSPRPSGERARVRGKKAQPAQVKRARTLRGVMTDAENRLWYHLRDRRLLGFKFVRQYPIGCYFADFACREAMLVVEADGGQHGSAHDVLRDRAIQAAGYTVLRFWNHDILNSTPTVLESIHETLASCVPSPFRGEGQGDGSFVSDPTYE